MRRFLFSLTIVVMIVAAIAAPAFAEEVNYRDYEVSVQVDGDNDIVTVDFPTDWVGGLVAVGNGTGIKRWYGSTLDWVVDVPSSAYQFYVAPFGTTFGAYNTSYNGRYLSLKNIPSDATFQVNFSFSASSQYDTFQWTNVMERAYSVTDNYASMYVNNTYPLTDTGDQSYTLSMQISASDGDGWLPQYLFHLKSSGENFEGDRIRVSVDQFRMTVSISSLYRLQEQSGITNDLLTEVNKQLADQGKTLDDILDQQEQTNDKLDGITDYAPVPDAPNWQDSVDQYEDVEQDAMQNVQSGMQDSDKVFKSVFNILGDYVQSFAAVSILFNAFGDIPFFRALLYVSLSLGIVAAILGIGIDAARSSARSSARSTRKARSG